MKKSLFIQFLVLLWAGTAFAQTPLKGSVKSVTGIPIPRATLIIRGTATGVSADDNGEFTITPKQQPPFYIRIRSVGFKAQDFQVLKLDGNPLELVLVEDDQLSEIVVTSRRRKELLQDVPIPVSVVGGTQIDQSGAFNVNRVKELIPSVQLYTSNPRNTGINIRGIGSPFGLTNDGLDPGVGFYVDGVYYARPAAATLDFIDVESIEVLRGPQGTLFGKNTAAGAFNITTRKPSFTPGVNFESSFGNYGYIQAKASVTGPLAKNLAGRLSFSGTQRDGLVQNIRTGRATNDVNNLGFRGQLLFKPSENTSITLAGDASDQKPDGYAQVVAGVAPTLRPAYRQFNAIISDLGYTLPSTNAFDRVIDHDTPWRSGNQLGGVSLNLDQKIGPGTLTSTTAWRYWNWDPSNDRDFTGLQALAKSQNPAKHKNWSQEIRYAGEFSKNLSGVVGVFFLDQEVKITGTEESGSAQWRFSQSTTNTAQWKTPGLFEGYGIYTDASIKSKSAAAFGSIDWEFAEGFHILPGARINYDKKVVYYNRVARGGLQTTDPALLALKNGVYSSQFYESQADEKNFTYQITAAYRPNRRLNVFATYSTSYKPVGVNVAGLPTVSGQPALDLAVIKPEKTRHYEIGVKTTPLKNLTLNLNYHNSDIRDYQTNVQSPELGVNRGYIANADEVNVKGFEFDGSFQLDQHFSFYAAAAYTDAKYVKFTNAPLPLEETGLTVGGQQVAFKDISGGRLPGVSKWAGSYGGEFATPAKFFNQGSKFFIAADQYFRSSFSSSPSPSAYLNIQGYYLVNGRVGFKATEGFSAFIWTRNLFNQNYFEQLLPAGGNAGHYAAVLGDQRTFGLTLRYAL
ncbi:TonB-dependent receptor [Mucilaginibacter myungsuensis]|uniref:TonB-dependent receptor n=1 Tax=Mucilaginibacter myungsuensis TaxID=649104 RepID=A0A929KZZ9_9SPHI|nr:TonB-dependent receptor [Mucilaginibacter myungsuensis]MBE9660781.1 TonB-dependent receptor [Mucilaginibacter myungsuensis]MDN3600826.1 TonB-dependent receptor [Mucilaginibacter myungsuensis]